MAMLLGAARLLQQHHQSLPGGLQGTVKLVFQPFEEGGAGADVIIKTGKGRTVGKHCSSGAGVVVKLVLQTFEVGVASAHVVINTGKGQSEGVEVWEGCVAGLCGLKQLGIQPIEGWRRSRSCHLHDG